MKRTLFFILWIMLASVALAQSRRFQKYADMDGANYVSISKAMLALVPEGDSATICGVHLENITSSLEGLQLINSQSADVARMMEADYNILNVDEHYQQLLYTKGVNALSVTFFKPYEDKKVAPGELIMYIANGKGSDAHRTFVVLLGKFTYDDVRKLLRIK